MTKNNRKIVVDVQKAERPIDLKHIVQAIVQQFNKGGDKNDR